MAAYGALQPEADHAAYGRRCPHSCHSRLTPTVATRSFKSIPMSRLGDGSCGDAFLDVGPACGN
jgi:hypothetical protein